jgi:ribonuclease HII
MKDRLDLMKCKDEPKLGEIEQWAKAEGYDYLFGIDEAGRGPWAGPVVCACVVFPLFLEALPDDLLKVNDSKQLKSQQRRSLVAPIRDYALSVGVAQTKANEIDDINILQATFKGMLEALKEAYFRLKRKGIEPKKPLILIDGNHVLPMLKGQSWQQLGAQLSTAVIQMAVIKGDARSYHIASASILAKEYRDRLMRYFDYLYPQYGFKNHMGYGTPQHQKALKMHGVCTIHRKSYQPIRNVLLERGEIEEIEDKTLDEEAHKHGQLSFKGF